MDNDLKLCYDAIEAKRRAHETRWRYYHGDHPIAFVNPRIGEVIKSGVVFKKNWCQVIINTSRDKLKIQQWNHEADATGKAMGKLWTRVLKRSATDIHIGALTTGESYLLAWPDKQGKPKAYYHDPRMVHVCYDDDDPQTPRVACKRWMRKEGESEIHWINLYYPDVIEHYVATGAPSSWRSFQPTDNPAERNPYGVIPVFHFRLSERECVGELTVGVLSIQDALNKLLNDMMVASEYSSFNQRWAIGNFEEGPIDIGPGTLLKIPPSPQGEQPASLGAFPATAPANYLEPLGALTNDMSALSGTPRHYFEGQGANISGEALQAMEGPLVAKLELFQQSLGQTWAEAMAFVMAIDRQSIDAEDIEVIWQDPHTVQPMTQASTRLTNTQAGIPIKNQLRDEGWTEEQLDQLEEDQQAQAVATAPPAAPPGPPGSGKPATIDEAAPKFNGAVKTPDIAGKLAESGALARALNRKAAGN